MISQDSNDTLICGLVVRQHLGPDIHIIHTDIKHIPPHTHGILGHGTPCHFRFQIFLHITLSLHASNQTDCSVSDDLEFASAYSLSICSCNIFDDLNTFPQDGHSKFADS